MTNGQVAEAGLQPLTDSPYKKGPDEYDEPKILADLLQIMRRVNEDPNFLEPEKLKFLEGIINKFLEKLPRQELHDFAFGEAFNDPLFAMVSKTDLRRQTWESNHAEISRCLHNFLVNNRRPPTRNELARETKLTRQTITNHLKQFTDTESFKHERKAFKMLSNRVLARLYDSALDGNVRASRLYFEMVGELENRPTKNFYIQINSLRVNEDVIKSLPQEAILQIESIIYKSIPEQLNLKSNANNT